ncbi:polysaccharide deacetylase family protein [Clostridium thailandense]|uniref:polysaccharide deacetylase family protein n=1 Tax=Clostridium thailandense TaxID=2794346 RepID=UPI003989C492
MIKNSSKQKKIKRKKKVFRLLVVSVFILVVITGGLSVLKRQSEKESVKAKHYKNADNKLDKDNIEKQNRYSNDDLNNGKIAYLTFDDGPSKQVTLQVLDILDEYNIKATFFVVGQMALQNKDIFRKRIQ